MYNLTSININKFHIDQYTKIKHFFNKKKEKPEEPQSPRTRAKENRINGIPLYTFTILKTIR